MASRWGVVLLAAGAGSRMGTRPKCLLTLGGQPLITRHLQALASLGLQPVVVLGEHASAIRALLPAQQPWVHNPQALAGQNGSLHLGLQALSGPLDAVMVLLADQPLVDAAALSALQDAFERRAPASDVLLPWHPRQAVPGNPVAFSQRVRQDILAAPAQWGCKHWQQRHPERVQRWLSDNPAYFIDLDTPQDLFAFTQRTGQPLTWPAGA